MDADKRLEKRKPYTQDQIDLLKRTIAVDHTDDELQLFLAFCQAKGLDPFSREVYSIKRNTKHGPKLSFQMSIDTFRKKAEESGEYDGQESFWCGPDGEWLDVWLAQEYPFASKVIVYRKGCQKSFTGIAKWSEYKPDEYDFMWRKMPALMLSKVAEALALRKAFPAKLGGIYATEEMERAGKSAFPQVQMPKPKAALEMGETASIADTASLENLPSPRPLMELEVKKLAPPKSKFFAALHAAARKHKISEEKMKSAIWNLYAVESSKDLDDVQAADLIKAIEREEIK